ncbi:MAG TPA: CD225/dispanin family protein [Saprospiraceae bacterium]|nr:CD225/dispanin family protein [Saprospiraceae bacterium]
MVHYYYTDGKERFGPFTIDQLKERNISESTLVWKDGLPDWVPARNLSDLEGLFANTPPLPPAVSEPYTNPVLLLPPKTWLIESVLVTLFCCIPFGIVGIIHATKVETLWNSGQREAAIKASQDAAKWVKISFITGFVIIFLYLLIMVLSVFSSVGSSGIEL